MTLPAVPDRPEVMCPWRGSGIGLSRFVTSDEEVGADVAVCPNCHRRVTLQLPLAPG
jgi:hypothetical protein